MPAFTTAVSCFLCKAEVSLESIYLFLSKRFQIFGNQYLFQVPYKNEDKSKLVSHLKKEHGANQVQRLS